MTQQGLTNKEAIERLKCMRLFMQINDKDNTSKFLDEDYVAYVANDMAIKALEKQIPKKPNFEINLGDYTTRFICECGKKIVVKHDSGVMDNHDAPNYCPNCGQRLNWSDND